MSYASVIEPMRAANLISEQDLYQWRNISVSGSTVACSAGEKVSCADDIHSARKPDILFVCAGGNPFQFKDRTVFAWLREMSKGGAILGGVSGGPVILAKANVVRGRRITVHWEHGEALREMFPEYVIEQTLYVIDRDRITCAGGVAPIDMMHALIAEHHGVSFAKRVSEWFLHTNVRAPGGAQRMSLADKYGVTNATILHAIEFMQNRMATAPKISEVADYAGVSVRQLNRLFGDYLGISPSRFFREMRLNQSARLLRQSSMSVTEIAYSAGFSSGAHYSKCFIEQFGTTPIRYRNTS